MRYVRTWIYAVAVGASLGLADGAAAQPAGLNPDRDCQTIRTCNFARNGGYRGCLSSYSCRVCRFVRSPCAVGGARRTCQQLRCSWG